MFFPLAHLGCFSAPEGVPLQSLEGITREERGQCCSRHNTLVGCLALVACIQYLLNLRSPRTKRCSELRSDPRLGGVYSMIRICGRQSFPKVRLLCSLGPWIGARSARSVFVRHLAWITAGLLSTVMCSTL